MTENILSLKKHELKIMVLKVLVNKLRNIAPLLRFREISLNDVSLNFLIYFCWSWQTALSEFLWFLKDLASYSLLAINVENKDI